MATPFDDHPAPPRPDRRAFLGVAASAGALGAAAPAFAAAISAESFGVRPDGSDQTGRLQSAIDAAAAAGRPLALAPGDHLARDIRLPTGASLIGPRSARLRQVSAGPLVTITGAREARLVGLTLSGLGSGLGDAPLVDARDVPDLVVDDVRLEEAPGTALALERCGGRIVASTIAGATTGLHSLDATGLLVAGNVVEDCLDNGIRIWRSTKGADGSQVVHNRIRRIGNRSGGSGEYGNGVNVFRAGDVLVSDNFIDECAFSAVRNNAGDGVQILSNRARACGEVALFTEFGFAGAVIASNVVERAAHGIVATNFNEGGRLAVISGNLVRDLFRIPPVIGDGPPTSRGIFVEAEASVTGNVIEGVPDEGLLLGWGPYLRNVAATGNVLRDCGLGIAVSVVEGVGTTLIASNLFAGMRRGAIMGHRWYEAVTGDLVGDARDWPHLSVTGNAVG